MNFPGALAHILLSKYVLWMSPTDEPSHRARSLSSSQEINQGRLDEPQKDTLFNLWLASRTLVSTRSLVGATRPLGKQSVALAQRVVRICAPEMLKLFWNGHPYRMLFVLALSFARGIFPVFKGYSHAMIINEVGPSSP
jgi:hypothetical protein